MELFALIPLIGFALSWRRWQDLTASASMLYTVSAVILVLFLGALLGWLLPVSVLLMFVGAVLAAREGYRMLRQKTPVPVPIGMLALMGIVFWAVHNGSSYSYYDEYSHWGVFIKEMLASKQLWSADTNAMHPRYLPGTSLWQFFFAVFSRNPEGASYLAQFVFLLTPLLVLWEKTNWRQFGWHLGIFTLVVVAVTNFGHGFVSLYVDHLLGAWFVGVLLNFLFALKQRRSFALLAYVLPLTVIVLIKTTGVFFAVSAAGIMALTLVVSDGPHASSKTLAIRLLRATTLPVATIVLSFLVIFVWNMNRDASGLEVDGTSSGGIVSALLERDSVFDSSQQTELTRRYLDVVLNQQISKDEVSTGFNAFSYPLMPLYKKSFRLTTASLLGLSLIMLWLLSRSMIATEFRQQWSIAAACVWLNAVAYIGILYLGYRYIAGNINGFYLSSYVRYAHSMLLPVVLFSFAPLLPAFAGSHLPIQKLPAGREIGRNSLIFLLLLAALVGVERPYLKALYTVQQPPEIRTELEPLTRQLRGSIGKARLWVFFPNNAPSGFVGQILQYQLSPGSAYIEEDPDVLLGDPETLRSELANWEYAWFPLENPEFDAALERLIGTTVTARIFRITRSGVDITFEPVADIF